MEDLVIALTSYAAYLQEKSKAQRLHHDSTSPSASPSESSHMVYLPKIPSVSALLLHIDTALKKKEVYTPIAVIDFSPGDRRQRYRYVIFLLQFSGGNVGCFTHPIIFLKHLIEFLRCTFGACKLYLKCVEIVLLIISDGGFQILHMCQPCT